MPSPPSTCCHHGWERRLAGLVGCILMFAGAISILIGKAGSPTVVLFVVAAPLVYGGLGLPLPTVTAPGARLDFSPPLPPTHGRRRRRLRLSGTMRRAGRPGPKPAGRRSGRGDQERTPRRGRDEPDDYDRSNRRSPPGSPPTVALSPGRAASRVGRRGGSRVEGGQRRPLPQLVITGPPCQPSSARRRRQELIQLSPGARVRVRAVVAARDLVAPPVIWRTRHPLNVAYAFHPGAPEGISHVATQCGRVTSVPHCRIVPDHVGESSGTMKYLRAALPALSDRE